MPGQGQPGPARTGRRLPRARDVLGALRLVLFAPEDLALVRGDPAERRRYLDELLVQRHPALRRGAGRLRAGAQAAQRAAAHGYRRKVGGTGGRGDLSTLDVWDAHLAQHGAELLAARLDLVARARARTWPRPTTR